MDTFIFKTTESYIKIGDIAGESQFDPELDGYLEVPDVAGESQYEPYAVWGTNGVAYEVDGMQIDPVIPGTDELTMPRVLGFEDPLLG